MWAAILIIPILVVVCAVIYVLFNRLDKYDKEKFNKRSN
jgi:ABC-type thiamin/hydroxymethylpyrimidine transport system permease subunit